MVKHTKYLLRDHDWYDKYNTYDKNQNKQIEDKNSKIFGTVEKKSI